MGFTMVRLACVRREGIIPPAFISASFRIMEMRDFLTMSGCRVRTSKELGSAICLMDPIANDNQTFLFSRSEDTANGSYVNIFSVLIGSEYSTIKNRVVVEHTGNDDGNGRWRCYKDTRATNCDHIVNARHSLQKYLNGDASARDSSISSEKDGIFDFPREFNLG